MHNNMSPEERFFLSSARQVQISTERKGPWRDFRRFKQPPVIYEQVYCQRGDVENRIKELHDGMQIGRTSCSNFLANTFRVLLTAAAYVLMEEMRLHLALTRHSRAQVSTLREHFLKLGAQVIVTVRRIVLHLPQAFPYRDSFYRLALSLRAQTG
jgi:Transposase DDE domain group 1